MKALTFDILLEQPVLVPHPGTGEENSLETYNFIPGSVLRGAFISQFLKRNPGIDISKGDPKLWFLSGKNAFLNGYPVYLPDNRRMLPRPLSWRAEKGTTDDQTYRIYDLAFPETSVVKNPVVPPSDYTLFNVDQNNINDVVQFSPQHTLIPHNASNQRRVKQSQKSFVFQYDVLSEGQIFSSAIIGENVEQIKESLDLNDERILFIGSSKSANYGKIRLSKFTVVDDWHEYVAPKGNLPKKIIVTLLSETICLNDNGESDTSPVCLFGVSPEQAYFRTCLVGGFNTKWGLPLSQSVAFQAGSVFVFSTEKIDSTYLEAALCRGIGIRRAEGYGRFAVNWNIVSQPRKVNPRIVIPNLPQVSYSSLSDRSKELASTVALRLIRQDLDHQLSASINMYSISNPPRPSQLSQIIEAAKRSLYVGNLTPISDRLGEIKQTARNQFENAEVKGEEDKTNLLDWLSEGISLGHNKYFWRLFVLHTDVLVQGFALSETQSSELKNEYISRFVAGFLRLVVKDSKKSSAWRENDRTVANH